MSAKDVLSKADSRGMGTKVAEYATSGPYHCEDCIYLGKRDTPSKGKGLCNQKVMLRDPQVPTDKASGLKIVDVERGCCRFVRPT